MRHATSPRRQVDAHHVGEARSGDVDVPAVVGGEHVVDVLVVALADELLDGEEERQPLGVGDDLGHPLVDVGDHVHPTQPLERVRVDDVRGAHEQHRAEPVVVVADEQHQRR
jgi:hypothetical protein